MKINKRTNNPYPYIRKSHILLLSSKFEGLPNVLLEGIALNKFIISSNCPTGPREILDNGKGGLLFKIENYKELSEKILFYKRNYKLCLRKKNMQEKDQYGLIIIKISMSILNYLKHFNIREIIFVKR